MHQGTIHKHQKILFWPYRLSAGLFWQKHGLNIILFALGVYIFTNKNIEIQVNFSGGKSFVAVWENGQKSVRSGHTNDMTSTFGFVAPKPATQKSSFPISNLTPVLRPDYCQRKGIPKSVVKEKLDVCFDYIDRYRTTAKQEMRKYGIPASITLAQGLLESNAGGSHLAMESNNHFGIKCISKCKDCTCRNYADDDEYDMFRVFEKPLDSFRAHSLVLQKPRYAFLHKIPVTNYEGWAHGLKKAGYATDPDYAFKLVQIINELELYRYDS
ncbi:MAG: glucosaminidase domain-containing protein [Saprospiraceae bacterium]|nr:glucosaminidase domain-containing protein [Saprospiraceae bacterium]